MQILEKKPCLQQCLQKQAIQKQPFSHVLKSRYSQNIQKMYWKTPVAE